MAPPARLELTTLRLGGVRSIQVSYGGMREYCTQIFLSCQPIPVDFLSRGAYTVQYRVERRGVYERM